MKKLDASLDAVGRPILAAAGFSGRLDPLKARPRAGRPAPQPTRPTNHRFFNRAVVCADSTLPHPPVPYSRGSVGGRRTHHHPTHTGLDHAICPFACTTRT